MAFLGGVCTKTKSRKPMTNHARKKTSGSETKRNSVFTDGMTYSVVWWAERRR